jgi:hypothetical protein
MPLTVAVPRNFCRGSVVRLMNAAAGAIALALEFRTEEDASGLKAAADEEPTRAC